MSISIQVKQFSELTTIELYNVLRLRSEVFVVEQESIYLDVDGKDEKALHLLGIINNKIVAYTRVFKPGDYLELASIGRVVVAKKERSYGYGYDIMKASIEVIATEFKEKNIKISAQLYLKKFYNNCGFKEIGTSYLEDGIPHIAMIK